MCYIFDFADTHFGGNEMGLCSAVLRLLDRNQHIYMYIYMYIEGVVHGVLFEHYRNKKVEGIVTRSVQYRLLSG